MRWVVPERFLGTDYAELHGFRELHGLVRIIQNLRINTDYADFRNYVDQYGLYRIYELHRIYGCNTDYTDFREM